MPYSGGRTGDKKIKMCVGGGSGEKKYEWGGSKKYDGGQFFRGDISIFPYRFTYIRCSWGLSIKYGGGRVTKI